MAGSVEEQIATASEITRHVAEAAQATTTGASDTRAAVSELARLASERTRTVDGFRTSASA